MSKSTSRTAENIINDALDTLKLAKFGYKMISQGKPEDKNLGIRNLVVFGRAVTNILQNLRSVVNKFDDWYLPIQSKMKTDPILKALYDLRTTILKKGNIDIETHTFIKQFNFPEDLNRFGPPPKNAKAFFMGDKYGGTGWELILSDGSTEKLYLTLPKEIGVISLHLSKLRKNKSESGSNPTLDEVGKYFVDYLEELITSAKSTFKI